MWIVDTVTWLVLWPTMKKILKDDPVKLAAERAKLFNIYSYVEVRKSMPGFKPELFSVKSKLQR